MTRVAMIINPNAGQQELLKDIDQISKILSYSFKYVQFYKAANAGDTYKLMPLVAKHHDLIIIAGGDGTVYEAINGISSSDNPPILAVLPGGTCNDFSRAIGMNQDPVQATKQIMSQKLLKVDVGQTNQQHFLNFWGIGLITKVSANINPHAKQLFGRLSYYISTLQQLNDGDNFTYQITTPEKTYKGQADLVLVSNGPFTGGIKPFFPKANIHDGLFNVLIFKKANPKSIITILTTNALGNSFEHDGVIFFKTPKLSITTDPVQKIDCDGEKHFMTPTHLKILKQHL